MVQGSGDNVEVGVELHIDASRIDPELEDRLDLDPRSAGPDWRPGDPSRISRVVPASVSRSSGNGPQDLTKLSSLRGSVPGSGSKTARPVSRPS